MSKNILTEGARLGAMKGQIKLQQNKPIAPPPTAEPKKKQPFIYLIGDHVFIKGNHINIGRFFVKRLFEIVDIIYAMDRVPLHSVRQVGEPRITGEGFMRSELTLVARAERKGYTL